MSYHKHPSSGPIDNPKSVSGGASGQHIQSKTHPHGLPSNTGVSYSEGHHQWESVKGQQDSSLARAPSSPTCMKGSDSQSFYESGRTDSGFLSGANLSSECQSVEITSPSSSRKLDDSSMKLDKLDSGVDVGLNEHFSSLSLKNDLNDLNATSDSQSHHSYNTNILISSPTCKSPPHSREQQQNEQSRSNMQPWELYFQQDEDGDTQLHIAIIQNFIEVVNSLIQMVPNQSYLDILNDLCQTPLHLAVLTRQPIIVRYLVVAGANRYIRDCNGNTALHLACQNGDIESVVALTQPVRTSETSMVNLQYIPYLRELPAKLEEFNDDGQMCVHLAALGGHTEVLRHLIWCGANINAREGKGGRTPLHYAIEYGIHKVAQFLLDDVIKFVNLETTTYSGHTAYQLAACLRSPFTEVLAQQGAVKKYITEDSDSDSDYGEDEMYGIPCDNYFTRLNGQPIDISA